MKKILLAFLATMIVGNVAHATQESRSALQTGISSNLGDASSITAAELRTELNDITDSAFILNTDTLDDISDVGNLSGASTHDLLSYDADSGLWYASASHEALKGSGLASIQLGDGAVADSQSSLALGQDAIASDSNTTAVGYDCNATGSNSTCLGAFGTESSGNFAAALGTSAVASASDSVAIGRGSAADQTSCVAVGDGSDCNRTNTVAINGTTANLEVSGTIYNGGKSEQVLTYTSSATLDSRAAGATVLLDCASCTITIPDAKYDALESFEIISYGGTGNSIAAGGSLQLKFADTLNFSSRYSVAAVRFLSGSEAIVTGGFDAP